MYRRLRGVLLAVLGVASFVVAGPQAAAAVEKPPLAPAPPMRWNSWNKFHCDINEELIRETPASSSRA